MSWSKKVESIISNGIALHDKGINNWALSYEQAIDVLNKFEFEKISVLGGDVYELNNDELQSNCDNWYCERELGESFEDYVERSSGKARDYISSYSSSSSKRIFFVFVTE